MGNHVDDGYLTDWTFMRTSNQTFHVHFHLSGTVGEATIRLAENELHWSVLAEQSDTNGEPVTWLFSPPKTATLVRQQTDPVRCPAERRRHSMRRMAIPDENSTSGDNR